MEVILDKEFNDCLNAKDILNYSDEVNEFIDVIKTKLS